ncbi:bifunctional proline dehydrogenase/L-glutamate gamma-semialdehyde dehydrogenase [Salinivibrio kushneri]|uniref:bifunctional proline dehydrogenase/L-glutamate gamma-semialdehyde dehydrogenase PutA n=1 Tax=Salinivibrio kushneri TaxID=1908198 RepID=UPI000988CB28|nr:bifunctional proline dehydrogenase/L-glutamate gamma-semialdehyde dehydrogenase PutA [Salinivibrio kushneri]OOE35444.1 bifunctional proline dehydrogenase/L-glutamate gamma-semialdehyde dehydrogenase [Salinivibrio kushneri]
MFKAIDAMQPSFIERPLAQLWSEISPLYCVDESLWLQQLIPLAEATDSEREQTRRQATQLIEQVRADKKAVQMIDALLLEYSLDTREGILLMCLAEALMRVPDSHTADALIRDKLSVADWKAHLRHSDSLFVNASTWGLMLTGKVVTLDESTEGKPTSVINRLVNKMSEPVIRQAMHQAMKIMGHQFVLGRDIDEAQKNGEGPRNNGFTYSFDMLGEAALTQEDAKAYLADYLQAIESVGDAKASYQGPSPSVSIKLSALHPRYEAANYDRMMDEMFETVLVLLKRAREKDVAITIDAEEADRLELSLALFEKLYRDPVVKGWGKFGLVVQAYSKRALPVITWLAALAKEQGDVIPMRLVKGAYWDSEIKLCQQTGHHGYPVFTRKEATDVSYLACARFLLSEHVRGLIYPQFASHNAHTIAAIASMATHQDFEFQRLHGMGDALYNHAKALFNTEVRIYAPVGSHKDLLPYLVRRLLENGANSSFVHRLVDARCPIDDLIADPVDTLRANPTLHNDRIPLPLDIFGASRKNSQGVATDIDSEWQPFTASVAPFMGAHQWQAGPIVNGQRLAGDTHPIAAPYDREEPVGHVDWATSDQVNNALDIAANAYPEWSKKAVSERGKYLLDLADKLEANLGELVAICHREAGKTIHDSIDEVREAVDFLRYYPEQAKALQGEPLSYTGFDGQMQSVSYQGRGVFTCISPWNFPLAIFLGQVSAALVAGNTVVAKPAEQTSIIAYRAIELLLETGIPTGVIQLLPGSGPVVGAPLTEDSRIAGVAFTGSTPTAQRITRTLAERDADPVPVVAETGGQNAMLVDSTALPEQVVRDVLRSAFASAGQRCSALRVLYIQEDIADRVISLIKGAMAELSVGRPERLSTDVGPVIDQTAKDKLLAHIEQMKRNGKLVTQVPLSAECDKGTFVPPTAFEIRSIDQLSEEHFGPILHIVRYRANELDKVIDDINRTGFGLTMGVHSRNETTCAHIEHRARVGNCYVNRDQVGAVVGVQPFGGRGLSGTGPKAGGPHYLYRFTQASVNVQ